MAQETHTDAEVICTQRITIKHKLRIIFYNRRPIMENRAKKQE